MCAVLCVAEVLDVSLASDGDDEWSGLATGWAGLMLYRFLRGFPRMDGFDVDEDSMLFPMSFQCENVVYTADFFAVLFGLIAQDAHADWYADLLGMSDLADDPVLVALCREALCGASDGNDTSMYEDYLEGLDVA